MVFLLGGDAATGRLPAGVPAPLQAYLSGALHRGLHATSAARLYHEFSGLMARLWGPRRFVPFSMPPRP
jgi:hypothetical protein